MRLLAIIALWLASAHGACALDVLYAHLAFKGADGKPYIETQVCILHSSLHFVKTENKLHQAAYRVRVSYITGNDTIQKLDYTLRSPQTQSPDRETYDLIDQRRTALPAGTYRIVLIVNDVNGDEFFWDERVMQLYFPSASLAFSSPLLVKSFAPASANTAFTRGGYNVLPYPVAYFPESMQSLTVYYEVYNAASGLNDTAFVLQYGLRTAGGTDVPGFQFTTRQPADSLNVLFASIPIETLEAGRYEFYLQALNHRAEPTGGTRFWFTRARALADGFKDYDAVDVNRTFVASLPADSLMMWLGGLYHLTTDEGKRIVAQIERGKDSLRARQFIFRFANLRRSDAPEDAWREYRLMYADVEYNFATPVRHGHETDRGRVFMQYGTPNHRNVSNSEPGAYPYEVWQYYRLPNGQTNAYFVFYLPGLATNDFKLIHSTARGELQDSRWRMKIYPQRERSRRAADPDYNSVRDHFGKRIDDYYPR